MISAEDYLHFVDKALDGMLRTVVDLGDTIANERLQLNQTNTPYVIVNHCLGVIDFWAGHKVAGPCVGQERPDTDNIPEGCTQGGALIHVLEELAQHRGQLQVTVDVLKVKGGQLA